MQEEKQSAVAPQKNETLAAKAGDRNRDGQNAPTPTESRTDGGKSAPTSAEDRNRDGKNAPPPAESKAEGKSVPTSTGGRDRDGQKPRMRPWFYPIFWLLSLTWGVIPTAAGAIFFLCLILAGKKPHRLGPMFYIRFGKHWGGTELGMFFLRDDTSTEQTTYHEAGHGLQNIVLGPFMLPIVSIPSFLRYHYRRLVTRRHPDKKLPPYDSIWFEGQATRLGTYFFMPMEKGEK